MKITDAIEAQLEKPRPKKETEDWLKSFSI